MRIILNKKITISLLSFFFIFSVTRIVFAVWDGFPYDPGETNNPECLPSDVNCDVLPAVTTEVDPVFTAWDKDYADLINTPTIPSTLAGLTDDATHRLVTDTEKSTWNAKQEALVSGINIKTINSASLLGSGDIILQTPLTAGVDYEVPLTFSSGLTRTANTITNNLITGLSGGQTIIGGTGAGENLTLSSTSNVTKGKILFGISGYDEVNNRLGVGTATPSSTFHVTQPIETATNSIITPLIVSGGFAYDGGGQYTYTTNGATSYLNQQNFIIPGVTYRLTYEIVANPNNTSLRADTLNYFTNLTLGNTVGTHTYDEVALTDDFYLRVNASQPSGLVIRNISLTRAYANVLVAANNGYVGIGTATPAYQLDISNGINSAFVVDAINAYSKIGKSITLAPSKTLDLAGNISFDVVTNVVTADLNAITETENLGAGTLAIGTYFYNVVFVTAEGESSCPAISTSTITTTATNSAVTLANLPVSPDPRVTARKIYRGTNENFQYYLATIANNTATTYQDTGAATSATLRQYNKPNTTAGVFYIDSAKAFEVTQFSTAIGYNALSSITSGVLNAAYGTSALTSDTTGENNSAFGYSSSPHLTTGSNNSSYGYASLLNMSTGSHNSGFGMNALRINASGAVSFNTALGSTALNEIVAGNDGNVGVGYRGGRGFRGDYNINIGYQTGDHVTPATVGDYNINIGYQAGMASGSGADGNILIGRSLELQSATGDNQLSIGNLIFGTGLNGTGTTLSTGNIGIRNSAPAYTLHVGNNAIADATVLLRLEDIDSTCDFTANAGAPSCGSDLTLKKNINDQSDNLSKILSLRPVTYNWLTDEDGIELKHGFIAQEVAEIMPELVTDSTWIDGTTKKFLQTSGMIPYIVGAIKEINLKFVDINNFDKENDWRDNLLAWLSNAENRITRIFTGEVCLSEVGEETVCLNRSELKSLKSLLVQPVPTGTTSLPTSDLEAEDIDKKESIDQGIEQPIEQPEEELIETDIVEPEVEDVVNQEEESGTEATADVVLPETQNESLEETQIIDSEIIQS